MQLFEIKELLSFGLAGLTALFVLLKVLIDAKEAHRARERLLEAEKSAYRGGTLAIDQEKGLASDATGRALPMPGAQDQIQVGKLFDLYSKQIEKYQTETQARAGWSFVFAIFSMVSGLSFVVWGGFHVLRPGLVSQSFHLSQHPDSRGQFWFRRRVMSRVRVQLSPGIRRSRCVPDLALRTIP